MVSNNITIAKDCILRTFSFLEKEGFKYVFKVLDNNDSIFSEKMDIQFNSESKKREINISYSQIKLDNEVKYGFNLSISRLPYKDVTKDYLSFFSYLDSLGKDFNANMVNHFSELEAEEILKKMAGALKNYAWALVMGEKWIEGFYPKW